MHTSALFRRLFQAFAGLEAGNQPWTNPFGFSLIHTVYTAVIFVQHCGDAAVW